MGQAADFFVSYTSADRAWAEWIAWQLEADGYRVRIQAWDFTPGRSWTHEMQQGTTTAERVVVVLSAAMLHLVSPRHAEEATLTGSQIAKASSSNATANRRFTGSSTASS